MSWSDYEDDYGETKEDHAEITCEACGEAPATTVVGGGAAAKFHVCEACAEANEEESE